MTDTTGLARRLAERICSTSDEDLPGEALRYARAGLVDTVGVTLAGSREAATRIASRVAVGSTGPSLLLGTRRRAAPVDAALVNGVAANVIDFDDCTDHLGGHPSAPVLSALLPLAERLGASGRRLLLAYVVGVETETQIARAVNFHHYEKGWHPTSTLGVFGAAAGSACLLGLSAEQTATALSICTSLASGIKANFGTMVKALHVGSCARNGLLAAQLAAEGYTANPAAFEHAHGFLNVYNGEGHHDAARALAKWGDPFDIAYPGLAIKQYPCCLSVQSAIDATLALVRAHDLDAQQVTRVEASIAARRLKHTDLPDPGSALEAKLSLQYCLARALLNRQVLKAHFEGDAHQDRAARELMQRIQVSASAALDPGEGLGAELRVALRDGRTYSGCVDRPVGHEPGVPLPVELVRQKFELNAGGVLEPAGVARVYEMLDGVDAIPDVGAITAEIERSTLPLD